MLMTSTDSNDFMRYLYSVEFTKKYPSASEFIKLSTTAAIVAAIQ